MKFHNHRNISASHTIEWIRGIEVKMETGISQHKISELLERFNSKKNFYQAESEGFGPCSILLLSQVRIYDEIITKINGVKPGSLSHDAVKYLVTELKQKIDHCSRSETYELDKIMIRTYEEIIRELEAVL
ncbi:MAG TPA: hypothetical protein PK514_11695 [Spirochaetota bacterium]|nr:hypothetical protein [Spirochaetota bacterium]